MLNQNNRHTVQVSVGSPTAAKVMLALMALGKKLRVHKASVIQEAAIVAAAGDYMGFTLNKNNVAVAAEATNTAGVAARAGLALTMPAAGYVDLAAGDVLSLEITETGTSTFVVEALLVMDVEVLSSGV